jgi:hypothetical protein
VSNPTQLWVDAKAIAVVKSLMKDVQSYDEGSIGMGTLATRVLDTARDLINKTYDTAFKEGVTAGVEAADADEDDTQLEFDLDDLREIGEDDETEPR